MSITRYKNPDDSSCAFVINDWMQPGQCEQLIESHKHRCQQAQHQSNDANVTSRRERDSGICFFDDDQLHWMVQGMLKIANAVTGWKYAISGQEQFQFTSYVPGQYYNWHPDGAGDHSCKRQFFFPNQVPPGVSPMQVTHDPSLIDTVRKISLTIQLNNDFEGGEFQTIELDDEGNAVQRTVSSRKGSIIFFPASTMHRVAPVTSGTRYSVVQWLAGPPFT